MTKTNLILDAEFTTLDTVNSIPKLISFALVAADGQDSFYGELIDGWKPTECSNFVFDEVLPHLGLSLTPVMQGDQQRGPRAIISKHLALWLKKLGPVRIWTDGPEYDWPLLQGVLGKDWPENVDRAFGRLLIPEDDSVSQAAEDTYLINGLVQHHALHDALVLQKLVQGGLLQLR